MRTDMLEGALDAYKNGAEGALAARLRFLEGLTAIQFEIAAVERPYTAADTEVAREALLTGQPLFLAAPPTIDRDEFVAAVRRVADYVATEAGLVEAQAEALRSADFDAAITSDRLGQLIQSPDRFFAEVAEAVGARADSVLKPATVSYVVAAALVPFLAPAAAAAKAALGEESLNTAVGRCPICGAPATLGVVHESTKLQGAERTLWCGLCHAEWGYNRVQCVRCGNQAASKLRYVHVEGDAAHRLHLCDECHGYTRTVFTDDLGKPLSLVVEDAVTAELDAVARSQGYTVTGTPASSE